MAYFKMFKFPFFFVFSCSEKRGS
uniref:Uncharacterized protein n=1 Tax=Anguilla anguilla TaxID=7936 RepID=A0A0E9VQ78_ANGAN